MSEQRVSEERLKTLEERWRGYAETTDDPDLEEVLSLISDLRSARARVAALEGGVERLARRVADLRLYLCFLRAEVLSSVQHWQRRDAGKGGQQAGPAPHRFPVSWASRLLRNSTSAIRGEDLINLCDTVAEAEKLIEGYEEEYKGWEG